MLTFVLHNSYVDLIEPNTEADLWPLCELTAVAMLSQLIDKCSVLFYYHLDTYTEDNLWIKTHS